MLSPPGAEERTVIFNVAALFKPKVFQAPLKTKDILTGLVSPSLRSHSLFSLNILYVLYLFFHHPN